MFEIAGAKCSFLIFELTLRSGVSCFQVAYNFFVSNALSYINVGVNVN